MLHRIVDNVYWWKSLQIELKRHLNGYVFVTQDGTILIDPPAIPDAVLPEIEALGKPTAVLVTGRHQARRAKQFQQWYNAKLCIPEKDKKLMNIGADIHYNDGDMLPGGFKVISLDSQRSSGESALYHAPSKVLAACHLVGEPAGYVCMQADSMYHNFSLAFSAQLALLDVEFNALLPGRGTPISTDAKTSFAKFLATYPSIHGL